MEMREMKMKMMITKMDVWMGLMDMAGTMR